MFMPTAQPPREYYRRKLPHFQNGNKFVFVSMSTKQHLFLPPAARTIVLEHVVREERYSLHCAVVMPDHLHLLFTIRECDGRHYPLAEIMHGIRGASAHRINRLLKRTGPVWQQEFFDRLLRYGEFEGTVNYICQNPLKSKLVGRETEYRWLWIAPDV